MKRYEVYRPDWPELAGLAAVGGLWFCLRRVLWYRQSFGIKMRIRRQR